MFCPTGRKLHDFELGILDFTQDQVRAANIDVGQLAVRQAAKFANSSTFCKEVLDWFDHRFQNIIGARRGGHIIDIATHMGHDFVETRPNTAASENAQVLGAVIVVMSKSSKPCAVFTVGFVRNALCLLVPICDASISRTIAGFRLYHCVQCIALLTN